MNCPKCRQSEYIPTGPCPTCGFSGDPEQVEGREHILFLLAEMDGWRSRLPASALDSLRQTYLARLRQVDLGLGLRDPPLQGEEAAAARLEYSCLSALLRALPGWTARGLLSPETEQEIVDETHRRLAHLQDRLQDSPPTPPLPANRLTLEQQRFLKTTLESLKDTGRLNCGPETAVYRDAHSAMVAAIEKWEVELGLRPAPSRRRPAAPAVQAAAPARPARPPRPPREPLTWERISATLLSERTLNAILFLGCILLFAAAVSLVVWNWETFPPWLQLTFLALFTGVFYLLGWFVRVRMKLRGSGLALSGVGSLLVPLDFYAIYLSGGFPPELAGQVWLLASLVCLLAYLVTVYLLQAPFFGYLVAVAAGSALASILKTSGVDSAWWPAGLSVLAVGMAFLAERLPAPEGAGRRGWRVLAQPFWWSAVLGALAILALSTGWSLTGRAGSPNFTYALATNWWLGGLVFVQAAARFKQRSLVLAALLAFPIAVMFTQRAIFARIPAEAAWYAAGLALLAPPYLWISWKLSILETGQKSGPHFSKTVRGAAVLLIVVSGAWALLAFHTTALVHPFLAAVVVLGVYLWRRPRLSLFASLLLLSGSAAFLAWREASLPQLALAWSLLAILHVIAALRLERLKSAEISQRDRSSHSPFSPPVYLAGWGIAALSLLPPLFSLEARLLTYSLANWILLNGWLALLAHTGEAPGLASLFPDPGRERARARLRIPGGALAFHWCAALALPPWLWLAWTDGLAGQSPGPRLALLYILAAIGTLAFSVRMQRLRPAYRLPWASAAHLSAAAALVFSVVYYELPLFAGVFLLAAAFYFASAFLLQHKAWFWPAGVTLAAGWMAALHHLGLPRDLQSLALAAVPPAFLLAAAALERYRGLARAFLDPLFDLSLLSGLAAFIWGLARFAGGGVTEATLVWVAGGYAVLALAAALHAWLKPGEESLTAHIAAWLGVIAGGLVAFAYSQGRGSSVFKAGFLAAAYVLAERGLLWASALRLGRRGGALFRRAWRLYRRPLLVAGWLVSGGVIILAVVANLWVRGGGWEREAWSTAALLLVNALYAAGTFWFRRSPKAAVRLTWLSAAMPFIPWTLMTGRGAFIIPNWSPPALPWYAVSWGALALLQLALGMWAFRRQRPERRGPFARRWSLPLQAVAHLLMPFALLWGAGYAPAASLSFGMGVAFYALAAWAGWQYKRQTMALYPAAALVPGWGAYLLAYFAPSAPQTAYGALVMGAGLLFLGVGLFFWSRAGAPGRRLARPFYLPAYAMLLVGVTLLAHERLYFAGGLLVIALAALLSARVFREPLWLYPAAAALPGALLLALAEWQVEPSRQGWALLALSGVYLLGAYALRRRPSLAHYAVPLLAAAFALTALALVPSARDRTGALVGYSAAAGLYALAAAWLRQPLLLTPATALLAVPYYTGLLELEVRPDDYGLAAWPFILVALLAAHLVDRRRGIQPGPGGEGLPPFPWSSPLLWLPAAAGRLLRWWALPFYAAAYLGAAAGMLPALNDPARPSIPLLLAAGVYALAVWRSRLPVWLLAASLAGQLAALDFILWLGRREVLDLHLAPVALAFTPVTLITALAAVWVHRRWKDRRGWRLPPSVWSRPLYFLLAVDLFLTQLASFSIAGQSAWVTAANALALGLLATAWMSRRAAYSAAALGLIALMQRLVWVEASALVWPWALALLGLGYGLAGYGLRLFGRDEADSSEPTPASAWETSLTRSGWLLTLAALMMSLLVSIDAPALLASALFSLPLLGEAQLASVRSMTAVFAISGLFFLAAGVAGRRRGLGYLSVGLLLAAWTLEWLLIWGQREVQWYAIPAGLYLLGMGYLEWRQGSEASRSLARWIDRAAVLLLLGSAFWQSLTAANGWYYALLMGAEGLLMVWWGSARRLKRFLYAGVAGVTIDVVGQSIEPLLSDTNRWIVLLIAGLVLVFVGALVERRLEQVKDLSAEFRKRLEDWQ